MTNNLRLSLRALNVPDNLLHKARGMEIKELVNYLSVNMDAAGDLALVNYGSSTPPVDMAHLPWIRLNPDGSPNGVFVNTEGEWVSALPGVVRAETPNSVMLAGSGEITFETDENVVDTAGPIAVFDPVFQEAPKVLITPTGGTLLSDVASTYSWSYRIDSRIDGFHINFVSSVDHTSAPKTLEFDWLVVGARK